MGVTSGRKTSSPLRWSWEKDYTHIEAREVFVFSPWRQAICSFIAPA
jgi:hypothetical protein